MEELAKIFENANSDETETRNEAMEIIYSNINSMSIDFLHTSMLILKNESLDYTIRAAASLYISRFLAPERKRTRDLEKCFKNIDPGFFEEFETSIIEVLFSDTATIRNECIHIMGLLLYLRKELITEKITSILSNFDSENEEEVFLSAKMFDDIINHPFIDKIAEIQEVKDILIASHESIIKIIGQDYASGVYSIELRKLAADALNASLTNLPLFSSEKGPVESIFAAMPASFIVPDVSLFTTLHQIMFKICVNNYQNYPEFIGTVNEYLSNDFAIEGSDYLETVLTFLDELTDYEQKNIKPQEGQEYLSIELFDTIFPNIINFIPRGLVDMNNSLYKLSFDILEKLLMHNADKIGSIITSQIVEHFEADDNETIFNVITLMALLGRYKEKDVECKIYTFLVSNLGYISSHVNSTDEPMIAKAGLWCLSEIFKKYPEIVKNDIDIMEFLNIIKVDEVMDPILLFFYIEMVGSICSTFSPKTPDNPFTNDKLFPEVVNLIKLLLQYPLADDNFLYVKRLEKTIKNFFECSSYSTHRSMIELYYSLVDQLEESLSETEEKVAYQSIICYILQQISITCKGSQIDYTKALSVLRRVITMHNSMLYNNSMPAYSYAISQLPFSPELFEEFVSFIEYGFDSGDASVIKQAAKNINITCKIFKDDIAPWVPKIFEKLRDLLNSFDDQSKEIAVSCLIRSTSRLFETDKVRTEADKENLNELISENKEWFLSMIAHFGSEITYSSQYEDEEDFGNEVAGAVCTAITTYAKVYQFESDTHEESKFLKVYYIPFLKNINNLSKLCDDTCNDLFVMVKTLSKIISKINSGRICHISLRQILRKIEKEERMSEHLNVIRKDVFGDPKYVF